MLSKEKIEKYTISEEEKRKKSNILYYKNNIRKCQTNIEILDKQLTIIELKMGKFRVSSGIRSDYTNEEVGGEENSLHLYGLAVDGWLLQYPNPNKKQIEFIAKWIRENTLFNEILFYPKKLQWHLGMKKNVYINLNMK